MLLLLLAQLLRALMRPRCLVQVQPNQIGSAGGRESRGHRASSIIELTALGRLIIVAIIRVVVATAIIVVVVAAVVVVVVTVQQHLY